MEHTTCLRWRVAVASDPGPSSMPSGAAPHVDLRVTLPFTPYNHLFPTHSRPPFPFLGFPLPFPSFAWLFLSSRQCVCNMLHDGPLFCGAFRTSTYRESVLIRNPFRNVPVGGHCFVYLAEAARKVPQVCNLSLTAIRLFALGKTVRS